MDDRCSGGRHEKSGGIPAYHFRDLLPRLATHDREALLAATASDGDWRDLARAATISTWRERDLPWCLDKCLEWKMEYLISNLDIHEFQKMPLIEHFDELPRWLRNRIHEDSSRYLNLDLNWLLKPPPTKMDADLLTSLRIDQASRLHWYTPEEFSVAAEVIEKCHFLDAEVRSELAEGIIDSHDHRELDRAEEWLAKIPAEFSAKARQRLIKRRVEFAHEPSSKTDQATIVTALDLELEYPNFLKKRDRPVSEYSDILDRIRRLPVEVCVKLIKQDGFHDFQSLLIDIKKTLLENAFRVEANRSDYHLGVPAR